MEILGVYQLGYIGFLCQPVLFGALLQIVKVGSDFEREVTDL